MPDQTWADKVIERRAAAIAAAAKIGTRSEIQMDVARALYDMRKYYERKRAEDKHRIAEQDQLLTKARDMLIHICDGSLHDYDAEDAAADWLRAYGMELDDDERTANQQQND